MNELPLSLTNLTSEERNQFLSIIRRMDQRRSLMTATEQTGLQYSLDDPRVRRIQELGANRLENSKEEEEELMQLILAFKKELPPEK